MLAQDFTASGEALAMSPAKFCRVHRPHDSVRTLPIDQGPVQGSITVPHAGPVLLNTTTQVGAEKLDQALQMGCVNEQTILMGIAVKITRYTKSNITSINERVDAHVPRDAALIANGLYSTSSIARFKQCLNKLDVL